MDYLKRFKEILSEVEDDELGEAYSNWVEMQVENGNILLN